MAGARADPVAVRREASRLLRSDDLSLDDEVALLAACGWADYERSLFESAISVLRDADEMIEAGFGTHYRTQVAHAISAVFGRQGRHQEAIEILERAVESSTAVDRAMVRMTLAVALAEAGQVDSVLQQYQLAIRQARRVGAEPLAIQAIANRAAFRAERDWSDRSERALHDVADKAAELGHRPLVGSITHNLGLHHARRGELPQALECFAGAVEVFAELRLDYALIALQRDHAEVLLEIGLLDEAVAAGEAAVEVGERVNVPGLSSESHIVLARIALVQRRYQRALHHAESAHTILCDAEMGQAALDKAARFVQATQAMVALGGGDRLDDEVIEALTLVDAWHQVDVGYALAERGLTHAAVERFEAAASQPSFSAATELDRSVAQAELAALNDAPNLSQRAVNEGLDLAREYLLALGTSSTRAHAARRLDQLVAVGVRSAFSAGDSASVVHLLDRARSLRMTPEPMLSDDQRSALDELRRLDLRYRFGDRSDDANYERDRRALERRLRENRNRAMSEGPRPDAPFQVPSVAATTVVYPFSSGGRHHAVVVSGESGDQHLITIGPTKEIERAIRYAHLVLAASARAMEAPGVARAVDRATAMLRAALAPMLTLAARGPIAVMTDQSTGGVPWALIADHPVTELVSTNVPIVGPAVAQQVVIVGAKVSAGHDEAAGVARAMGDCTVLEGDRATAANACAAMEGASSVHLVAHGRFRTDYPWFSELLMVDGPLLLIDLLGLEQLPEEFVFSACNIGRNPSRSPIGLVSALTAKGCGRIIASSGEVNDAATATMMADFHRRRSSGEPRSAALFAAQAELIATDPSVAFFTCYGTD